MEFDQVQAFFRSPDQWNESSLFKSRPQVDFDLGDDEFFPMGDNSPFSKDSRLWGGQNPSHFDPTGSIYVDSNVKREMLIGKAFMVYWPHTWYPGNVKLPLPVAPNLDRMGLIR